MSTRFLDKISSYLFIFNPCISLQLTCPCANFHFILFHFILFFIFACSKSSIVFVLSLDPFLADLPVLCPPENARGLLVFWCFQGAWNGGIGHIWINQWWSYLADCVPSLCPLGGGGGEKVVSDVFGGYRMKTLARNGSSTGSEDTSSKKSP